ncbi:hypothetical protein M8J75_015999 [Diaphorina citri]|nr:hypothetical protein M8J75_015999 [Diaphorina citri]
MEAVVFQKLRFFKKYQLLWMRRQREDIQVKVREATSNDPWGPSSSLMSEIADLTYNVVAFTEIMAMIWKRLNDSGKNWRHVYKALSLLEYLIKTGSDKVAFQCKENIFLIQTLRDFQYTEEGKDQGFNVREKAKALATLLGDEERLRNERARQLKARERFARSASSGFGSEGSADVLSPSSPTLTSTLNRETRFNTCNTEPSTAELECARPQTAGEEELQLQLALAMSREEAEQEEQKKKSDEVRLQLALSQSENEFKQHLPNASGTSLGGPGSASGAASSSSHMLDLLEVDNLGAVGGTVDPWASLPTTHAPVAPTPALSTSSLARPQVDPWSCPAAIPAAADPWAPVSAPAPSRPADPWAPVPSVSPTPPATNDPWSLPPQVNTPTDEFAELSNRNKSPVNGGAPGADPFDVSTITEDLRSTLLTNPSSTPLQPVKKTPQSFLGENSALVNLDNLITAPPAVPALPVMQAQKTGPLANPFSSSGAAPAPGFHTTGTGSVFTQSTPPNLFEPAQARPVTINQMRSVPPFQSSLPQPLVPSPNPFLS